MISDAWAPVLAGVIGLAAGFVFFVLLPTLALILLARCLRPSRREKRK